MILPAQRRQKKVTDMLKALKTGDKVITNGGIYGTIVGLEDEAVQLRVAEQVKMKVARSAIAGLQAETSEGELESRHEFPAQMEIYFYRCGDTPLHLWPYRRNDRSDILSQIKQNLADRIKLGLDF